MELESFINQKEIQNLYLNLKNIQDEINTNSYNLFTLSSYNTYLENFHSDVIAILLNPNERHKENNLYINLFLDYLISLGVTINKDDYILCEITREKGRIDIWIKDNTSKKSIIIENKINDAVDQEKQIENYYKFAENSGFKVDAVVYLTLNGNKNAPLSENNEINKIVINIPAFTNIPNDLTSGWLLKCYNNASNEENKSFLYQYIKLLKHLSRTGMDKQIKDEFYSIINKNDCYRKSKVITQLMMGLEEYRADLFATRINNNYLPFRKIYRWRPNHWLFENFNDNGIIFKLDVHFHSDGTARIDFWNPGNSHEIQEANTSNKLTRIDLVDEFKTGGFGGGMFKEFKFEDYSNLESLDIQLYSFVKMFFEKLA